MYVYDAAQGSSYHSMLPALNVMLASLLEVGQTDIAFFGSRFIGASIFLCLLFLGQEVDVMKKLAAVLAAVLAVVSFAGCEFSDSDPDSREQTETQDDHGELKLIAAALA